MPNIHRVAFVVCLLTACGYERGNGMSDPPGEPVSITLSAPDSVVAAGASVQLKVTGRDAQQREFPLDSDITFTTSNPFGVLVSPTGVATALFNPFEPNSSVITATFSRNGATLIASKRIEVGSPAPPVYEIGAFLLTESVEPNPVPGLGLGISFFTVDAGRVHYKMLWSLLSGPPVIAHIHGPDAHDKVAPILVELPLGTQAGTHGVATGSFAVSDIRGSNGRPPISLDSLIAVMKSPASAYIDVHTDLFVDGELRGPSIGFR